MFFNFRLVEVTNPVLDLKMTVLFMWKPLLQGDYKEVAERVRLYLANGFNLDEDRERDKTLLHAAAIANNIEVARLALDAGVDVDAPAYPHGKQGREKMTIGWTALFYAVRNGNQEMARLLLDHGASAIESAHGETPMGAALRMQAESVFWVLVEYGLMDPGSRNTSNAYRFSRAKFGLPPPRSTNDRPLEFSSREALLGQDTIQSISSYIPPAPVCGQLSLINSPAEQIRYLETALLESFNVRLDRSKLTEYCASCSSGLASSHLPTQELWKQRESRVCKWKVNKFTFNYGFLPRCGLCRVSLLELPYELGKIHPSVKTAILPSDTQIFPLVQSRNCEGN
jgi:ankyrin repeat protein